MDRAAHRQPAAIGPVSLTPSSGNGSSGTFSFLFADPSGPSDINYVEMNFGSSNILVGVCYLYYNPPPANVLYLLNDEGTAWVSAQALGTPGTLQNSQCSLDAGASTSFASQNNLIVNLVLTFKPAFVGNNSVYAHSTGKNWSSGWQTVGTWSLSAPAGSPPPTSVSVTPNSGNGSSGAYNFLFTDPAGYSDISAVAITLGPSSSALAGVCYLSYSPPPVNALSLLNDAGTGSGSSQPLGTPGTLQNSQCSVDTGASSSSGTGNNLTITLALTFKSGFAGNQNIYASASGKSDSTSGWQSIGSWTVPAPPIVSQPPSGPVSVTPSSGSGSSGTFSFLFADPGGPSDINYVTMNVGSSNILAGVCYLYYNPPPANVLYLLSDAGTTWVGAQALGTPGTLQNSQCSLDTGASASFVAQNNLIVNMALTFKLAVAGNNSVYADANGKNWSSGWQTVGTWSLSAPAGSPPPTSVSVTPNSGNGSSGAFAFLFTDPNGYADISSVAMNFGASNSTAGVCYLSYNPPPANTLSLLNDAGTAAAGSQSLGTAGTLQNSQCSINTGASSSASSNNLTLSLALTFKSGFAGNQNIYASASGKSDSTSGWQSIGSWTVPVPPIASQPPSGPVSVTPDSGSGSSTAFNFLFADPNGAADISYVVITFGPSSSELAGACYLYYNSPPANVLYLLNDAGTDWVGAQRLGTSGTLQNSQCSLNMGASSPSGSGSSLTVNLALTFKSAFAGSKSVYAVANGNSGWTSNWLNIGTWTVP